MKALIDGDILIYTCGFAAEHRDWWVDWYISTDEIEDEGSRVFRTKKEAAEFASSLSAEPVNPVPSDHILVHMIKRIEPLENALHSIKLTINSILEELQTKEFTIYITGKGNFRLVLDPEYKANRDPNAKPYYYKEIKEYLLRAWDAQEVAGYEADDALTCDQMDSVVINKEDDGHVEIDRSYSCICSIDKDLDMVPGFHYNWQKDRKYFIHPEDGIKNFYRQLITGDSTDNIPGLYKVTGKRYTKQLKEQYEALPPDPYELWKFVIELYGHENRERVITNGKLLWMVRYPGDVWEPPND